jgi:peptidyl-prolyl cis-trans isomerase D
MFAILIGAFAISMGSNNYFDRYRRQTIASVGSVDITPDQYDRAYRRVLDGLSQRAGRRISTQEAKSFDLPNRVLQGMIQDAAVDWEADKLGLGVSDAGLRQSITNAQMFQDGSGTFSQQKYEQFLQQIGYSAPFFEQEYKGDLIRRQLQGVFEKSGVLPKALLEAYNRFGNEQRTLLYFTLPAEAAGAIEAPSEATLKTFYDERKAQFTAPELRKVAVLPITPQSIAGRMTISDDDLKAEYNAKSADYAVPERRKIELIPFKTRAAADAAHAELKAGKGFLDVAKEAGFTQPELDIGLVSKKEFAKKFATSDAIIEEAFTTDKGWTSRAVDGPLSSVLMRVLEIIPGEDKSFAEVKDQIRADLLKARSTAEASKLVKAFEEDRASGVVLADSAKKLHLPLEEVTFDRSGKGAGGKPIEIPGVPAAALVDAAFKSDVGVENDALRVPSGGYAWYEVLDIVKPRQKPFEEVKTEVEAAWRKDQIRSKLAEKARDLVARLNRGEPIADVAKSAGAEIKTSQPLKREGSGDGLPTAAVGQAFTLGEHGASSAASADSESRVVFEVEKIVLPPPLNEAQARGIGQQLARQIGDDSYSAYLSGIMKTAGVTIDDKTFAKISGGSYEGGE